MPITVCPLRRSRFAIYAPMRPSPTKPSCIRNFLSEDRYGMLHSLRNTRCGTQFSIVALVCVTEFDVEHGDPCGRHYYTSPFLCYTAIIMHVDSSVSMALHEEY